MVNEIVVRIGEGPGFDYQSIGAFMFFEQKELVDLNKQLTIELHSTARDYNDMILDAAEFQTDEEHFIKIIVFDDQQPDPEPEPEEPEEPPPGPLDV